MVTDGIDRARRSIPWRGLYINPDVDSASEVAMRTGTIIHTIYAPGVGRQGTATTGKPRMDRWALRSCPM